MAVQANWKYVYCNITYITAFFCDSFSVMSRYWPKSCSMQDCDHIFFFYVGTNTLFCYISSGFAMVQNLNVQEVSLNVNALSCWKINNPYTNPTLNLPDNFNKCRSDIKTYFSDATVLFIFIIHRFEVFRRTIISQESYWSDCVLENMELYVMITIKSINCQVALS